MFQVRQDGYKLNSTHQLLVYAGDVSILGWCINTIKKNTEALIVASKESGMEVDTEKCKNVVMFWEQQAGQN
jgi:hypothetical protein